MKIIHFCNWFRYQLPTNNCVEFGEELERMIQKRKMTFYVFFCVVCGVLSIIGLTYFSTSDIIQVSH